MGTGVDVMTSISERRPRGTRWAEDGRHLALVFKHEIDPAIDGGGDPATKADLQATHDHDSLAHLKKPPLPGGALIRC